MHEIRFEGDDATPTRMLPRVDKRSRIASIVMQLSGGSITGSTTANVVALAAAGILLLIALWVIPKMMGNQLPSEDIHTKSSQNGEPIYRGVGAE